MIGDDEPYGLQMGEQLRDPLADNVQMRYVTVPRCGHFWHECPA